MTPRCRCLPQRVRGGGHSRSTKLQGNGLALWFCSNGHALCDMRCVTCVVSKEPVRPLDHLHLVFPSFGAKQSSNINLNPLPAMLPCCHARTSFLVKVGSRPRVFADDCRCTPLSIVRTCQHHRQHHHYRDCDFSMGSGLAIENLFPHVASEHGK